MRTLTCLLLPFLVVASCCLLTQCKAPRRQIVKVLELNNGIEWGSFGPLEYCEDGSFAEYAEAKFEEYSFLDTDETALNALRLYCSKPDLTLTGYITSTEGENGKWQGMKVCHHGFLTAMRARVLEPQGALGDDVAVQNFQLECDYGREILTVVNGAYRVPLGQWGEWSACPENSAICGLRTRYNAPSLTVDDAGVTDMLMFCCSLNATSTSHN